MSPYELAREVYRHEASARTFEEDVALHFRFGYVFSTPDAFIMGRPIQHDAPHEEIILPWVTFPDPDCWLVWLAAGPKALEIFLRHEPFPCPYFAWERDNRLRFYTRSQLIRNVTRTSRNHSLSGQGVQGWHPKASKTSAPAIPNPGR